MKNSFMMKKVYSNAQGLYRLILVVGIIAIFAVNLGCSKEASNSTPQSQSQSTQSQSTTKEQPTKQSQAKTQVQSATKPATKPSTDNAVKVTYTSDIEPILANNCVRCHNPNGSVASLPLDSYNNVMNDIEVGDPESSELIEAVDGGEMSGMLTTHQLQLLKKWIKEGAVK